jgi:HEAT repeat protein
MRPLLTLLPILLSSTIAANPSPDSQPLCVAQFTPAESPATDLPDAIKLLKNKDPDLRALGARSLARLGNRATIAIPELIAILGDREFGDRSFLFTQTVGQLAAQALISIGPKAIPSLSDTMLKSPDATTRTIAASTLVELLQQKSVDDRALTKTFDQATADNTQEVRRLAVQGLGLLGPKAAPTIPHLISILKDDRWEWVRFEAATSLSKMDPKGETVIPHLLDSLKDPSPDVSGAAARAIGSFGPAAKSSVRALTAALDDRRDRYLQLAPDMVGSRAVRGDVAEALGLIGAEAAASIPALRTRIAKDRNPDVRVSAALAISRIDPKDHEALPAIIKELERKAEGTAGAAAALEALSQLGPKARAAIPALRRSLAHEAPSIRADAAGALAAIGDLAVIPDLERLLADEDNTVLEAVRTSLAKLRDDSQRSEPPK